MSEMIERVAKAIYASNAGAWSGTSWEEAGGDVPFSNTREAYFREARAAIEAMREPTRSMVKAAALEVLAGDSNGVWREMIDAALSKIDA